MVMTVSPAIAQPPATATLRPVPGEQHTAPADVLAGALRDFADAG